VDDGSVNLKQSRNMLKIAHQEGIQYIIATPHYGVGCVNPDQEELHKKLEILREEAKKIDENFRIELGNELFFSDDILVHLRKKKALTLAGTRYVLVEFATFEKYEDLKVGLHRLLIQGYLPILAHVERYDCLYENYEGIDDLIYLGAYMQMNITSVLGKGRDKIPGFCRKLLDYGMIHFLGTDSHSDSGRAPVIKEGLAYLYKRYGVEMIDYLLFENAAKLLNNEYV
jgi:protein-tyrosine phosphatase